MKPIQIPCPKPDFQIQNLDGEIVLLHPGNNTILHLNPTGALVWQMCNGLRTVDEIVLLLGETYPEARAEIARDVPEIIQQFAVHGALFKE
jgi:hypothetical protein